MTNCSEPCFSIVIPTYRRPKHPSNLLSSLTRLMYRPSMFEVVVVDDGGDIPFIIDAFSMPSFFDTEAQS